MGEAGVEGQGSRMVGGSLVQELLEAGLIDDMTEVFLLKRDVNVIQALPIQMGRFGHDAGISGGDVWRGSR